MQFNLSGTKMIMQMYRHPLLKKSEHGNLHKGWSYCTSVVLRLRCFERGVPSKQAAEHNLPNTLNAYEFSECHKTKAITSEQL